jgi:hypothetical protein
MREAVCPQCRSIARLVRNPYYGAGLAVHRDLLVCEGCGYAGFAPNEDDEGEQVEQAVVESPAQRAFRRLIERMWLR